MKRKDWEATKAKWYKLNPPNHQLYWECSLCGKWTQNPDLDHIKGRGSNPQLANNLDNLRAVCRDCHRRRHDESS